MSTPRPDSCQLGFLRIVEIAGSGHVGGLLITNRMGRPLEFQCTTPVKANRTQEILYGPTLKPFLFSEMIGKTLFDRAQVKPHLILVDQEELLDLRDQVAVPVACVLSGKVGSSADTDLADQTRLQLGGQMVRFHPEHPEDIEIVRAFAGHLPTDADMREPIMRVGDALEETLRAA